LNIIDVFIISFFLNVDADIFIRLIRYIAVFRSNYFLK